MSDYNFEFVGYAGDKEKYKIWHVKPDTPTMQGYWIGDNKMRQWVGESEESIEQYVIYELRLYRPDGSAIIHWM